MGRASRRKKEQRVSFITFKRNAEGVLAARIGNLEVGFFPHDGCYIVIWGEETGVPCAYTNSDCPEDKQRDWRSCRLADNCPYEFTREVEDDSTVMINEGTRAELEAKIRDMFRNRHDGIAHEAEWPEPAAGLFASLPWQFGT